MEERWQVLVGLSPGHIFDSPVSGCLLCFLSLESLCVYILKATWTNRFVGALGQIKWPFNFYELVSCEGNAPEWEWNCTRLEKKKNKKLYQAERIDFAIPWQFWRCKLENILIWTYIHSLSKETNEQAVETMYTFFSFAFLRIIINFFSWAFHEYKQIKIMLFCLWMCLYLSHIVSHTWLWSLPEYFLLLLRFLIKTWTLPKLKNYSCL